MLAAAGKRRRARCPRDARPSEIRSESWRGMPPPYQGVEQTNGVRHYVGKLRERVEQVPGVESAYGRAFQGRALVVNSLTRTCNNNTTITK